MKIILQMSFFQYSIALWSIKFTCLNFTQDFFRQTNNYLKINFDSNAYHFTSILKILNLNVLKCLILQSSCQNSSEQSGCSLVCKWKLKLIRYRDELMTKVGFIFRTLPFVLDWIHYLAFMVLKSNDWGTPHLIKRYVLPNEL